MASSLFNPMREKLATAQFNWVTGVVRAILLPDSYSVDLDAEFLAEIPSAVRVATSLPISGRTATDGWCTGSPAEFPLLFDNREVSQAVFFKDTDDDATSPLIAHIDSAGLVTTAFVPVGLDYFIIPNLASRGFFRI